MKKLGILINVALLTCTVSLSACSQRKEKEPEVAKSNPAAEQAAKAIRDELRAPINKALKTQELGDNRTDAIDRALQQK
jgi:cytochrome c-type biogenesis protein CcmH/NrfF